MGKDSGELYIKAICGSLNNTITIEDIYKYIGTNASAISSSMTSYSLNPLTSITPTISSDGTNIVLSSPNSSNGWQRGDLSFLHQLNNFKMSMRIVTTGYFGFQLNNGSIGYLFSSESRWIQVGLNNTDWNPSWVYQSLDTTKEYTLEITVNGSSVGLKIYNDTGTEIVNTSKTMSAQMTEFGLVWIKNDTFKFRDLKVRQL